jgi:hypothetical protein
MGEEDIRYQCRKEYREGRAADCLDRFGQDSRERIWWLDEVFKIAKDEEGFGNG